MFRRKWSGLPKDATFAHDLAGLGYFVNEEDEIRSCEDKNDYFKFFINRNPRINQRQKFCFNHALENIIHDRLVNEGLVKVRLPLGVSSDEPHVPIFTTTNLSSAPSITVVFGETIQQFGLLANRVASGPGGIDKGSMVSVVRALTKAAPNTASRGIILANMGETHWWPEERRPITVRESAGVPLTSLVKVGMRYNKDVNEIPQNRNAEQHAAHLFQDVLPRITDKEAKINILAVGDSCEVVERFLDKQENWHAWEERLGGMVLLETYCHAHTLKNGGLKDFLSKHCRAYVMSSQPLDTPLASPLGNPQLCIEALGCPVFSSFEPEYVEKVMVSALPSVVEYLEKIASNPEFENPPVCIPRFLEPGIEGGPQMSSLVQPPAGEDKDFETLDENEKPYVSIVAPGQIEEQLRQLRKWDEWEETGEAPLSDDEGETGPRKGQQRDDDQGMSSSADDGANSW